MFIIFLLISASLVSAYSFVFTSQPQQCADLALQISGSGDPPYSLLIIPYGPSPLPNDVEVRTIVYQEFSGDASELSLQLKYPAGSQFVAVVSDSSAFGTGGTSVAATVTNSSDATCFNATKTVSPDFFYNISPANQVVQCSQSRLWWNASQVEGTPNFQGVIPGGDSFSIQTGTTTEQNNLGTGFAWTPAVLSGSTLLVVAGDDRGLGTGGSNLFTVSAGLDPNSSCISSNSPSSTAGPPAGGSYPTNTSGGMSNGSGSANNTSSIVGGVIGGLAAIAILGLVAFYVIRRKTSLESSKERAVNLLYGDPDDNEPSNYQPPPYLQPEPYLVTAPTVASSFSDNVRQSITGSALLSDSFRASTYGGSVSQRQSLVPSLLTDPRSTTPELIEIGSAPLSTAASSAGLSNARKSGLSRQLRAVNIIQHEDAGPNGTETIELPPAYTHIRREP